jgi:hypothetical protein
MKFKNNKDVELQFCQLDWTSIVIDDRIHLFWDYYFKPLTVPGCQLSKTNGATEGILFSLIIKSM